MIAFALSDLSDEKIDVFCLWATRLSIVFGIAALFAGQADHNPLWLSLLGVGLGYASGLKDYKALRDRGFSTGRALALVAVIVLFTVWGFALVAYYFL